MPLIQLLTEEVDTLTQNNVLTLYHYSNVDKESFILDPKKFGEKSFARSEKKVSDYPRIFFYLDPDDKERFYRSSAYYLYTADVPRNKVYHLNNDPLSIIKTVKDQDDGVLKFDNLFERIIGHGYSGIHYRVKNRDVVVWFEPIEVHKVEN